MVYGFPRPPPLDVEISWVETHDAFAPANFHKVKWLCQFINLHQLWTGDNLEVFIDGLEIYFLLFCRSGHSS